MACLLTLRRQTDRGHTGLCPGEPLRFPQRGATPGTTHRSPDHSRASLERRPHPPSGCPSRCRPQPAAWAPCPTCHQDSHRPLGAKGPPALQQWKTLRAQGGAGTLVREGPKCSEGPQRWPPSFATHRQEGPRESMLQVESERLVPTRSPKLVLRAAPLTACHPPPRGHKHGDPHGRGKKPLPKCGCRPPRPPDSPKPLPREAEHSLTLIQILYDWGRGAPVSRSHRPPK